MASNDAQSSLPAPSKKVRLACRRCRAKRVKCDGGIPACGNCARVGAACVDVDGRNNGLSIPRDFATRCCARIRWLEQKIKQLDPAFDLKQGPPVDTVALEESSSSEVAINEATHASEHAPSAEPDSEPDPGLVNLTPAETSSSTKRSFATVEESEIEQPVYVEARSVAIELGMLSLHSDSRQKHYLGSSSGLLFTKLIGLDTDQRTSASPASSSASTLTSQRRRMASPRCPSRDTYQSLYTQLERELPTPEEAGLLLAVYFQDIHVDHPFLHPRSLLNAYRALNDCARLGCNGRIGQNGWVDDIKPFPYNGKYDTLAGNEITPVSIFTATFHTFMAFSLAATVLTRNKNFDHSPDKYYRMAMSAASECFSGISVTALQGVLLLIVQGLIGPAGINIWTLSYIATSHCIDLGLHREPTDLSDLNHTALTVRRLIFHTVYSLDRSIATIQGRPLGIRDETFDVRHPTKDDIAQDSLSTTEGEDELDLQLPPPEVLSLCIYRFRADQYISEIKLLLYRLPAEGNISIWPTDLTAIQERIKSNLDDWLAETASLHSVSEMDDTENEPLKFHSEKLKLEMLYHSAVTLLYQPSQVFRSPTQHALTICYQSSRRRLQIYKYLSNEERLYYNWRHVHGIFSSGATIVYCFWASRELQDTIPFAEALRDLRTCSNLLSIGSQWWPSVRSGKESFDKMVDLTIKRLSQLQNISEFQSTPRARRRLMTQLGSGSNPPQAAADLGVTHGIDDLQMQLPLSQHYDGSYIMPAYPESPLQNSTDPPTIPFDEFQPDGSDRLAIDSAMEGFLAEYLHGDWGWDPFSGTTDNPMI